MATITEEDVISKLYHDMTRLAGEIAVDRCRMRVLLRLVKEEVGIDETELDALFRDELKENLESQIRAIMQPMLEGEPLPGDEVAGAGCCGGCGHEH